MFPFSQLFSLFLYLFHHWPADKIEACSFNHVPFAVRRCQEKEAVAAVHFGCKAANEKRYHPSVGGEYGPDGKAVGFGISLQTVELFHMYHVHSKEIIGQFSPVSLLTSSTA